MAKNKKLIASVAAVATSAALLLGGTLAWQSTNQTALNEASDVINPGGRLHDDFDGTNKDVYVENFADENIYARIRLEEYFEIITNYGKGSAEKPHELIGSKTTNEETGEVEYTYELFTGYANMQDGVVKAAIDINDVDAETGEAKSYWSWQTGGSTVYMPTFNLNKDSLLADVNGIYEEGNVGTISNRFDPDEPQYTEYTDYMELGVGYEETANELYDGDANDIDEFTDGGNGNVELADIIANGENSAYYTNYESSIELVAGEEHTATTTLDAELISMDKWLEMVEYDNEGNVTYAPDNYWVYDEDGWVYWSAPIEPHTATGLLLDGIELNQVMDDTWYYAINVIAQFVTADDVGKSDSTGFYAEGEAPSADAETLLEAIGVDMSGEAPEEEEGPVAFRILKDGEDEGVNYRKDETAYLGAGTYTLYVSSGEGGLYTGATPDGFEWNVSPEISFTKNEITDNGEAGMHYVSMNFTFDESIDKGTEFTFTATNEADNFEMEATVVYSEEEETPTHYLTLTAERSDFVRVNAGDTIKLGYPGSEDAQSYKTYAVAATYSTDDLAMSFASSPTYSVDDNGNAYIEINKTRYTPFKWNLWGCSEGDFSLTSNNAAVTFELFSGGEASQGDDMYIVIPTSVTEEFTVTATAVNDSSKSVTFTVRMLDQAEPAIMVIDYTTDVSSGITLTEGEDYTYNHDTKELVILIDNFVELWVWTPDYSYAAIIFHAEEDDKGPESTVNASFSTTNDLNAPAYTVLTKESADSDLYTLSFVRSTETITAGEDMLNGAEVAYVSVLGETHASYPEYDEYYYDEMYGTESGCKVKTVQFLNTIKPRSLYTWFLRNSYLESIDFGMLDASWVINIGQMFTDCHKLTEIDMSGLDFCGNTVDSYLAFNAMNNLETLKLPKNIVLSGNMGIRNLFGSCPKLSIIEGLENLDVSENSDFSFTFHNCSSLTSIDLSSWDMSNVTDFDSMFSGCTELVSLKLPDSLNTSNVTNMNWMFSDCEKLIYDCSDWDVSNVTEYYNFNDNAPNVISPAFSTGE